MLDCSAPVREARELKGLPSAVIAKHASSAADPVLTLAGINLVIMVNVSIVVETSSLAGRRPPCLRGIAFRDSPVWQATVRSRISSRQSRGGHPVRRHRPEDQI